MIIFLSFLQQKNALTGISHIFILTQYTRVIGIYQEKNYNFRKIYSAALTDDNGLYKKLYLFANTIVRLCYFLVAEQESNQRSRPKGRYEQMRPLWKPQPQLHPTPENVPIFGRLH